ncbi:MAG: hypothetical protein KF767_01060 [Bdellovibrionaceae bacterium]|nr:hypothetical protein [Pseudobdellovibrionaceae bacterium]
MIHSTFDAFAQFLHRKSEEAKRHSLRLVGPRMGPWLHSTLVAVVVLFVLYLVLVLIDTTFDLGLLPFLTRAVEAAPQGGPR